MTIQKFNIARGEKSKRQKLPTVLCTLNDVIARSFCGTNVFRDRVMYVAEKWNLHAVGRYISRYARSKAEGLSKS